jgi:N-methylhydantoinase A
VRDSCRVGIDVGGTFTDFVLVDSNGGRLVTWKEPSTPADPVRSVIDGFGHLLERTGLAAVDVDVVVHGTTLALNAILQERGARIGLVVSRGFGDLMVIGRGGLPNSFSYKDPKRQPLVPRRHVYEVPARLRVDGSVMEAPSDADIERIAASAQADGLEALAVLVINSYAHPEMEVRLARALAARLPDVLVTASAELWPEVREFERALVAVLNGYIHPMMDAYYGALDQHLTAMGLGGRLEIATSNGGTVGVATARRRPIDTLLSGPAAGVSAGTRLAAEAGVTHVISVDMGGTSSDMSITRNGEPEFTTETRIGTYPVIIPAISVWTIGAGGGSVLWADPQGLLKVGPRSAGADPGPTCYGRGGTEPTITDCYLVLGYIDPARFLGGRMTLDREAAAAALSRLGEKIGIAGAEEVAEAAMRIATAKMSTQITKGMAQRGYDLAEFTLLPYGGAGPTQAALLAEETRLDKILIPPSPGTFCAFGAVTGQLKRDFARSRRATLTVDADAGTVFAEALSSLEAEARAWTDVEVKDAGEATHTVLADMQYPKTAVELTIAIPPATAKRGDPSELAELFHIEHERLYGFRDQASPVYFTTVRLTVSMAAPALRLPERTGNGPAAPVGHRPMIWRGERIEAEVFTADSLAAGAELPGPAIVEMTDSTVLAPPGWTLACDSIGSMHLTRKA